MLRLVNLPSIPAAKSIKTKTTPPGVKTKPVYKYVYDEKYGCPRRVLNGYMDLQEYIQQSADDIDFKSLGKMLIDTKNNVISHFDMNGEVFDQTALPRDVREYEALYNKIKAEFDKLPAEMRELFGNDLNTFKTSWMNGSIGTILNNYYQSQTQVVSNESKEGETK